MADPAETKDEPSKADEQPEAADTDVKKKRRTVMVMVIPMPTNTKPNRMSHPKKQVVTVMETAKATHMVPAGITPTECIPTNFRCDGMVGISTVTSHFWYPFRLEVLHAIPPSRDLLYLLDGLCIRQRSAHPFHLRTGRYRHMP